VIINHGFTGRWTDSTRITEQLAAEGYVVLRYSSRGFGKTPGEVDLMGPKERQDLLDAVHWLNDPANPVVGGMVTHNRIGQFGGSYGGAHAWSLALANDPAVRTVVPTATWTDIYDALLPNDVALLAYANGFYATGFEPTARLIGGELSTTDNYSQNMHRWVAQMNGGIDLQGLQADLVSRSVTGRLGNVNIPVFLIQGTNDGLFSQNQALDSTSAASATRRRTAASTRRRPSTSATRSWPGSTTTSRASTTASTSCRRSSTAAPTTSTTPGTAARGRPSATRSAPRRRCTSARPARAAARCLPPPVPAPRPPPWSTATRAAAGTRTPPPPATPRS
jgi:predicted acyl esterase